MAFWESKPSVNTPINGINLSRSERYIPATAGANGDFFVNINGASGLASGDILRIKVPVLSNLSSNARLSIDGGTNYKDCRMGTVNLTADELSDRDIVFVYDGTYWGFEGVISGSNANGNWQKFSDGTMTCSNRKNVITTMNTAFGSFFITPFQAAQTFPKPFSDLPSISFDVESSTNMSLLSAVKSTTSASSGVYGTSIISTASVDFDLSYIATGQWY